MSSLVDELREACDLVAAEARERGHLPHAWQAPHSPLRQVCFCRACGTGFRVSVSAGTVEVHVPRVACPPPVR